ncbi:hypothetical protein C5167_031204 [Papaver somniferum]|nr:hypothetical protein C5167_031204 [Papaver somniferum]
MPVPKDGKEVGDIPSRVAEEVAEDDEPEPEPVIEEVACSDFYDFGGDKSEEWFAVDQIWVIYDYFEGMPRSYVWINRVDSPFKVDVTWLEFVAGNIDENAWKRSGLPVACGKFKLGNTTSMLKYIGAFSHKVFWKPSVNKSYKVYPRKGETWALYKNWGIEWSSDPDKHREYEYEFVLVLSDYSSESGILVVHLVKLKGFVCLLKPTKYYGMDSFQIPSNEMLRFSHRVPSFRTNGKSEKTYLKHPMPKKRKNPDPESTRDGSSPGGNKNPYEERRAAEASDRLLDKGKGTTTSVSDREKNAAAHAKEMSSEGVHTIPRNVDEDIFFPPCSLKISEVPGTQFYNFDEGRTCEKFKAGQVWALYCKLDKFPKKYAKIESVESLPVFKLSAKWLKSFDPPRGIIPWADKEIPISCGKFKVASNKVVVFHDSISFSHQLREVPTVNNVYVIHPRAGEVWALYHKFRSHLTCSDLKKGGYEIVEILEVVNVWIIMSVLERVSGCKTVFKAKDKEILDSTAAIPWIELYRFSHQVPAFMLSGARYGTLRDCWELDPRSLAASDRNLDKSKATSVSDNEKNAVAPAKEMSPDGVITTPGSMDEDIPSSPSSLKIFEMPGTEFCNFDEVRSREKFKTGQIWALYCKLDKIPKNYAQIESVDSFPVFKLCAKWLKSCDPPRGIIPLVDKEMPVSAVYNVYTIHPREGEVWALYSKFRSDLKKGEYDIVEIVEVVDVHWIIVSVLERVAGFKTVFRAKEKEGLDSTGAIPWIELYRFSHQIPTFMLSGARYGELCGCWELDPRSLAVY